MLDAYVYGGFRTPIGRYAGALAAVRPDDLLAGAVRELMARTGVPAERVEDVIVGCACQAGEDARNLGRHVGLLAGLPVESGGQTINRLCGSSLAAVVDAARAVTCGEGDLFVAGGVESMTRAPFVLGKSSHAYGRSAEIYDSTIGARFPNRRLVAEYGADTMPETADNVARDLAIGREESDRFAASSQTKYQIAKAAGFYDDELVAVTLPGKGKGPPVVVSEDEHPRPGTTFEQLSKLRPLSEGGVVTAGNASGINDGAVALLVGSKAIGEEMGLRPLARLVATAVAGVPPRVMGLGPVPASQKALARAGLSLADMDVIELNEAFASQVLGCLKQLELSPDDSRLNPNGGAIAIGHPLGATGARLVLTAMRQLVMIQGRYALATMCIGVGQGIACIMERVSC
ncbi:MAG: 3-oxoadipyl-CoA thiolase [Hyphomicrobiales bacterium]|nr:3-oxoadipyl-CoA thiolase [Hyphomicrobiales bacterium]